MDLLSVKNGKIVDGSGAEVRWRGTCVGGWMNMENFIDGYPGSEQGIRATMAETLGESKATFFFDRLLDYFLAEDDIAFIKECGATVVRLPFNYRHFEEDMHPFDYLQKGFDRLGTVVDLCEKHGLYVILDHHAVQGWQNTDWHCDNPSRTTMFWHNAHFQERFVRLWEELARRYAGRGVIAAYNVMNEPYVNQPHGRIPYPYTHDWDRMNGVYRRVTEAIRAIDPDHIIVLEGDCFSSVFHGLEVPFADNLVYSSHNYNMMGFGPGPYPNESEKWNRPRQVEVFEGHSGTMFTREHNVPLWVGEFGSVYNGPAEEVPDRLRALDDQIDVFEESGAHWTTWTYKDVGVMGWVTADPESEYVQRIAPSLQAKRELRCDQWQGWLPATDANRIAGEFAELIEKTVADDELVSWENRHYLEQALCATYTGELLQRSFCRQFAGLSEKEIDRILQSFAFANCRRNEGLIEVVKKHTGTER